MVGILIGQIFFKQSIDNKKDIAQEYISDQTALPVNTKLLKDRSPNLAFLAYPVEIFLQYPVELNADIFSTNLYLYVRLKA